MEPRTWVFQSRQGDARLYVTVDRQEKITGSFFGSLTTMSARRRGNIKRMVQGCADDFKLLGQLLASWEVVDVFEGDGQLSMPVLTPRSELGPSQTNGLPTSSRPRP